ncbi:MULTISPECIES: DUF397 domain-containing protein [unclassified Streptomyces]|uniref:DUF397 domain-containing protein n=1 Tax=unclassified Streptomyces TaxID=2593676 RepID=UPI00339A21A4
MSHFEFVKSSYSSGNGECVEIARNVPCSVAVRDSKRPDSPVIVLGPAAWDAFRSGLVRSSD